MGKLAVRIETRQGAPVIVPANQRAIDELRAIQRVARGRVQGVVVNYTEQDWQRERYWGVLDEVSQSLGINKADLHNTLKYKCGLIKGQVLGDSGPVITLKSIANKSNGGDLTPSERRKYFEQAYELIFMHFVDAHERPALFKRVEERLSPRPS